MQKIIKQLAVIFSVLLVISNLVFLQPQISYAQALDAGVTITALDEEGERVLPLTAISIDEGDTAFDVLLEAGELHNLEITYDEYDFGVFITGIGDAVQTDSEWWSFNVYGHGPDVGASSYQVTNGEHILFTLTDEFSPTVPVIVSAVDMNENDVIPETEVTVMEGASAYDALYQAAKEHQVEIEATIDDEYFTFINNLGEIALEENEFWNISVNDEPLMTSIVAHQVQSGEHVQLEVQAWESNDEELDEETETDETTTNSELPVITNEVIQESIAGITNYISEYNISIEYGNEWWAWGVAHTEQGLPSSYVTSVEQKVKELDGEFRSIFDLEKVIIGLSAANADATNVAGYNLIEKLLNHRSFENPSINMAIYGLLALDSGSYDVPDEARDHLIDFILDSELENGGWALFGDRPTADITGMVLISLAPYQDRQEVKGAIERAVTYLSAAQDDTGGYYESFNGGDSSESVSQVITGLAAVGVDPTGNDFTKDGGNLVQHLLKFKQDDGGYSHLIDDTYSMGMSTQQALLAFFAYQKYVNGEGSVYQFNTQSDDGQDDEEEKKEEEPDPSGEDGKGGSEDGTDDNGDDNGSVNDDDQNGNDENKEGEKEEPKKKAGTTDENPEGKKLPQTATNTMNILFIGLVLLLVGASLFMVYQRKKA
ncbi:DUF4430 domain-containing protein [Ornithinibacillus caprae]|nr:DUF4430 domain-containing protein [Ornithinibacillus caprae]